MIVLLLAATFGEAIMVVIIPPNRSLFLAAKTLTLTGGVVEMVIIMKDVRLKINLF